MLAITPSMRSNELEYIQYQTHGECYTHDTVCDQERHIHTIPNVVNVTPMVSVPSLLICIQCMVKFIITLVSSNLSQDQQRHLHATKGTNYASVVICIVSFLFLLHLLLLTRVFSDLMICWW